VIIFNRTLFL